MGQIWTQSWAECWIEPKYEQFKVPLQPTPVEHPCQLSTQDHPGPAPAVHGQVHQLICSWSTTLHRLQHQLPLFIRFLSSYSEPLETIYKENCVKILCVTCVTSLDSNSQNFVNFISQQNTKPCYFKASLYFR